MRSQILDKILVVGLVVRVDIFSGHNGPLTFYERSQVLQVESRNLSFQLLSITT